MIEDTIRRNASPIPLDDSMLPVGGESCSSIASSASDEQIPRTNHNSGGGDIFVPGKPSLANNYFVPVAPNNLAYPGKSMNVLH